MPGEELTLAALPQLQHLFGDGLASIRRTERFVQLCEEVGTEREREGVREPLVCLSV